MHCGILDPASRPLVDPVPQWEVRAPLAGEAALEFRRNAIFSACKWDPQIGDQPILASFPLVISRSTWRFLAREAETLARETAQLESFLLSNPAVHRTLGLPRTVRRALSRGGDPSAAAFRVLRFDFHPTDEGWRVSEVNSDVPGGFVEASGVAREMLPYHSDCELPGDPVDAIVAAFQSRLAPGDTVGLVHATAYTDDREAMVVLARRLTGAGLEPVLLSPANLAWRHGHAHSVAAWRQGKLAALFRFFPAEWLPNLSARCGWHHFFRGGHTPCVNPAWSVISQSKRFPLAAAKLGRWDGAWCRRQPETCDPRHPGPGDSRQWVLKPALGRIGEDIGLEGVTPEKEMRAIRRAAFWRPGRWAAQKRFRSKPLVTDGGSMHLCLGVYVIDGHAAGIYGRISDRPLIDSTAQDIAVFVPRESSQPANSCPP